MAAAASTMFQGLSYALCTLCGLSLLLNIMTVVITMAHKTLREDSSLKYVRYSTLLMALANLASGIGVMLFVLWPDTKSSVFCDLGAFLTLFGTLESMWLLLVCCSTLMARMRSSSKVKTRAILGHIVGGARLRTVHRWSFPIFLLSMLLKAVILAMLVFLSLTKMDLFKNSNASCQLITLWKTASWEYSVVLLGLGWAAALPTTILSLCNIFLFGPKLMTSCKSNKYSTDGAKLPSSDDKFTHKMAIAYLTAALLWIIVLMTSTVIIFSGNGLLATEYVSLALGYAITLTLLFSAAVTVVVMIMNRRGRRSGLLLSRSEAAILKGAPPSSLASMTKLSQQKDELRRYQVQWLDRRGELVSGVMKVYHPACLKRWRCEVNAIAKLSVASHPNVAEYLWESNQNKFGPAVCRFTGDLLSPECSVTCMLNYPHGTLSGYLKSRSHMTEVGLHKVTLDIARGLGFIHQNHLVHNGLTTETVYMSSVSGKIGLRAVIGDFENSYEVSENTLRKSPLTLDRPYTLESCSFGSLYSISQQMDMANNKFSPDIRSFGMVVLEMLIALGEFDEHSGIGIHYRSQDIRRNSLYDNTSLGSSQSQPMARKQVIPQRQVLQQLDIVGSDSQLNYHYHDHHGSGQLRCKCSPRVTDIRAIRHSSVDSPMFHYSSDGEQVPTHKKLQRNSSAFASVKSLQEEDTNNRDAQANHVLAKDCMANGKIVPMSQKRVSEIQRRDLPPVPPRHKTTTKSPARKQRTKTNRPTCDIIRLSAADVVSSAPEQNSSQPHVTVQLEGHSESHNSQTCDLSPSSEDFYSLSVGSLGSFETIYEDEEKNSPRKHMSNSHYQNVSSMRNSQKVVTGKPPVFKRKGQEETMSKKRFSISSANDSVFSSDSGVGSYASDTYSDVYSNRMWRDIQRGRREMESPDSTYYLKVRKQPCSKQHPEPGHMCMSDPGFSTTGPTDSSASNTDTLSSEEPTYDRVRGNHLPREPKSKLSEAAKSNKLSDRDSLMNSSAESVRFPIKDLLSNGAHPAIKQQYRFAVPRLGISAVLARRLSDASLSSVNSSQSRKDFKTSRNSLSISKTNISNIPDGPKHSKETSTPENCTDEVENNHSLSSSIISIIQDSNNLLNGTDSTNEETQPKPPKTLNQRSYTKNRKPSISSSKTSLNKTQQNRYNELTKVTKFLDCVNLDPKEKTRVLNMLKLISRNDSLGFIGQQLMSLFSDCWLEDPVPSADEILQRLNLVLPTASV